MVATDGGADSRDFLTKVQVFSSSRHTAQLVLDATFARFPRFPAEDEFETLPD